MLLTEKAFNTYASQTNPTTYASLTPKPFFFNFNVGETSFFLLVILVIHKKRIADNIDLQNRKQRVGQCWARCNLTSWNCGYLVNTPNFPVHLFLLLSDATKFIISPDPVTFINALSDSWYSYKDDRNKLLDMIEKYDGN